MHKHTYNNNAANILFRSYGVRS